MSGEKIHHKILKRLFDVQSDEAPTAGLMFVYFFLITAAAYIIIPVKISLYLEWLSFEKLPYAYLLTAVLIGFVVTLNSKLMLMMKRELYVSLTIMFFIINLFLFWILFKLEWRWLSMIFWFWEDIFLGTSVTQFWIIINDLYNPRQTRRLVGFLVSGGLLGGVVGSLIASLMAKILGTENLLLVCPVMLFAGLVIVRNVHRKTHEEKTHETKPEAKKKTSAGFIQSLRLLKSSRHLLLLCGIVALSIIVSTLIDFQFNTVINNSFPEQDTRTSFLGTFFTVLLVFSYLLHVFTTNKILKNFGLKTALLIAPFFLLLGSAAIFALPAVVHIFWAVAIKGVDKSLAHSLNQSVRELLYIPIPPEIKYKSKVFIDMFVSKFAKGIGAVFLLIVLTVFHFTYRQISYLSLVFIGTWIACCLLVTKEYVKIVKRNLSIKWQDADEFLMDNVDIDTTKLVFDTIESKSRSSVLYAMNLFDLVKRDKISPGLKKIISNKSDEIQACSLDSLMDLDGGILFPELDDSIEEESLDIQVKEIMEQDVYQVLMKEHFDKIINERSDSAIVHKMEAAKAFGMMSADSTLTENLRKLLKDDSPEVLRYALESAGKLKKRKFVPYIIKKLDDSKTKRIASQALVEYGSKITGTLKDYLSDPEEDVAIRKQIPDILAGIGTQRAADSLAMEFRKKHKEVENEVIESLYKLKSNNPQLQVQENIIQPEIIHVIKKSYAILLKMHDVLSSGKKGDLVASLERELAGSLKHIFELLTLIYPKDDIIKAYQNIATGKKKAIDYSLELLDNILKKSIKDLLFPLIDDISFEDKVRRCKRLLKSTA
ncbi:MAG: Npt1/Npt2 family nucleotide transporter [Candidatus Aminicenantes bacterium]